MSGSMEVEVKYRLADMRGVEDALTARGAVLSAPSRQDDQAYAPQGWSYGDSKIGVTFARLRTQDGRHLFTVKRPLDNELACLEHQTEVADREEMHRAVMAMGFYPTVRIVKVRRTATLGDLSICIDEVDHAGAFMEIERMLGAGESGVAAQDDLDRFATSLGVKLERTTATYDSLVRATLAQAYVDAARGISPGTAAHALPG